MLIKDVMTRPFISISPDASAYEAREEMKKGNIRRLPVVQEGRVVGIVTDRDIREAAVSSLEELSEDGRSEYLRDIPVSRIMTKTVTVVSPNDRVERASYLMRKHKIGGLPVVDRGRIVGIITESDIFRVFTTILGGEPGFLIVEILDTDYARKKIVDIFFLSSDKIQTLLFSPEGPEIIIVFRAPKGNDDALPILEKLAISGVEILDWELFQPARELVEAK